VKLQAALRAALYLFMLLAGLAVLAVPGTALANVVSVTATASPAGVPFNTPATVLVSWNVSTSSAISPNTITSISGDFLGPGLLGSNPSLLSRVIASPPLNVPVSTIITEVVRIPSSITYQANKNGQATFSYQRFFSDSDGAGNGLNGVVIINIQGTSSGDLNISRVELRFDTNQNIRVAGQGEKLTAVAEINYSGIGLLDAVWEVADPASTRGEPFFVPVRILRQYLGAGRNAVLQSPPLPTSMIGTHLVRLRIKQPVTAARFPALTYHVNKQVQDAGVNLVEIRLSAPGPGARYSADTSFSWLAVEGASAYQLEIHDAGTAAAFDVVAPSPETQGDSYARSRELPSPVTGILLPAEKTSTTLTAMSRQYLRSGHRYRWRVIAIGDGGAVIGESGLQEISTP
jgi:hypothetical protein